MTIVSGLAPGERGDAAASLGAMLARSTGDDLVVAAIVPTPWPHNPYRIDKEFLALQERAAHEALARARATVGADVVADYVVESGRSVSFGLLEIARGRAASLVVLGSSGRGLLGLVTLGGVAERVLHSLGIPVSFAPAGYTTEPTARIGRITVGFGRADHDSGLLASAAARAKQLGGKLRVACFAVRPSPARGSSIEESAEALVVEEWVERLDAEIDRALVSAGVGPADVETVIGEGGSWREALAAVDWAPHDLLAIGASTSAVSRFFLGSHASKVVRNSPVPVLIVSRSPASDSRPPSPESAR